MSRRLLALTLPLLACGGSTFVEPPLRTNVEVSPATAVLTWENGVNAHSTLVVRTTSTAQLAPVKPGADAGVGDVLGTGVVVGVTEEKTFTDRNLPDLCGPFTWHLWARAVDGSWAREAASVSSLRGANTIAPTAEVTRVRAVFEGGDVRILWDPPEASTAFEGVTVVRRRGAAPTSVLDGATLYSGPSSSVRDTLANLSPAEPTYYGVFNCNQCGRCGNTAPSVAVLAPADGGASLSISDFTAQRSADGQRVELAWATTAPRVKVLRGLNAAPVSPTDPAATVVFDGAGVATSERLDALLPNLPLTARRYTYAAWGCIDDVCSATSQTVNFSFTLAQALQGGGYTLYFQHATATTCADDTALGTASSTTRPNWWRSCEATCSAATAAQLTPGVSALELAGVHGFFADGGVPVSRVLASEFCRAQQTVDGFGLGGVAVEPTQALTYFVYDEGNRCRDTLALLNAKPADGTSALHVGHPFTPGSCAVLDSLNPAEAAIYKPQVGAPAKYVGRVLSTQWSSLP